MAAFSTFGGALLPGQDASTPRFESRVTQGHVKVATQGCRITRSNLHSPSTASFEACGGDGRWDRPVPLARILRGCQDFERRLLPCQCDAAPQPGWGPAAEKLAPHAESEDLPPSQSSSSLSSFSVSTDQHHPCPPRPRAHSGEGSATAPTPPPKPEFLLQRSVSSRSTDAQEHQNEIVLDKGSDADFVLENRPTSSGVFVKEVNPQGSAVGKLQVGDKILKVDDLDVSNAEVNYALGALVSAGSKVRLTLLRQQ
ncbi:hypothetical protein MRX96_017712 [Rhipicephalus microplus]